MEVSQPPPVVGLTSSLLGVSVRRVRTRPLRSGQPSVFTSLHPVPFRPRSLLIKPRTRPTFPPVYTYPSLPAETRTSFGTTPVPWVRTKGLDRDTRSRPGPSTLPKWSNPLFWIPTPTPTPQLSVETPRDLRQRTYKCNSWTRYGP